MMDIAGYLLSAKDLAEQILNVYHGLSQEIAQIQDPIERQEKAEWLVHETDTVLHNLHQETDKLLQQIHTLAEQ